MSDMTTSSTLPVPAAAPPTPRRAPTLASGVLSAASALLLVDLAIETFLVGSPILWTVMGVEVLALALLALLWARVGPTTRLAIPLAALVGLVAWAGVRLGSGAEPGLRMATLTLPRVVLALSITATVVAAMLPFGFAAFRRAWYLGAALVLAAALGCAAQARGFLAGASFSQVASGTLDWQRLPAWLHGAVLATQVVVPIGLLAAVALAVRALVRRRPATWPVAGLIVLAPALLVQSSEMTRAGRASIIAPLTRPLLERVTTGPTEQGPPIPRAEAPTGGQAGGAAAAAAQPVAAPQVSSGPVVPAPPGAVGVAQAGQAIADRAIELRVTGVRTAASVGSQTAEPGREFVIVDSAWKNILPPQKVNRKKAGDRTAGAGSLGFGGGRTGQDRADDEANTTVESVKFEVGPLSKHLWLVADGRFAEPVDAVATRSLDPHLGPDAISIASFQQVVAGGVAFRAPAGSQSLSLLFLDAIHGHVLVPIKGAPPVLAASLGGGGRANELVDLALTGTSWSDAVGGAENTRTFVVGLRGISRQPAIVDVPFGQYAFLQTDQGCLVEPDAKAAGLTRPLAPTGRFLPFVPSEGQLAFALSPGANAIALLIRLQQGGPIDLPLKAGATPSWPPPAATVTDGDVLRARLLPGLSLPRGVPPGPSGSERVALDLVVENLRAGAGIELQPAQQFRLVGPDGKRYEPSRDSAQAPCRLAGENVVPAGGTRRFTLVYDVPQGGPLQLEYRGFNVKSELVKVR